MHSSIENIEVNNERLNATLILFSACIKGTLHFAMKKTRLSKKIALKRDFFLFVVNSKDFLKIIIYFINSLVSLSQ